MWLSDHLSDSLSLMSCIKNYIKHLLCESCQRYRSGFFTNTLDFIDRLEFTFRSNSCKYPKKITSGLRHALAATLQATCVTSWYNISVYLYGSLVSAPPKYVQLLEGAEGDIPQIQALVSRLQSNLEHTLKQKQPSRKIHQSRPRTIHRDWGNILALLESTGSKLQALVGFAVSKAKKHVSLFNTASTAIGIMCTGRLCWALWEGRGYEELLSAGTWTVCAGLSSALLQIPPHRTRHLLRHVESNKQFILDLEKVCQSICAHHEYSYADLVLDSPTDGTLL
ncbi:hypothetical protein ScPMuIL_008209 [Solemya velum]